MRFSIITVCFNAEAQIESCIKSVVGQTFNDYEHVIIDGQSSDKTMEIVKKYSHEKLVAISEKDSGIYNAMNKGLNIASGDYVLFLNSDDAMSYGDALLDLDSLLNENDVEIITAGINYINEQNQILTSWMPQKFHLFKFLFGWHTPHPGFVAKRSLYLKVGKFNESLTIAADFELMLRLCINAHTSPLVFKRAIVDMYSGGVSSSFRGIMTGFYDIFRAFKINNMRVYFVPHMFFRYLLKVPKFFIRRVQFF